MTGVPRVREKSDHVLALPTGAAVDVAESEVVRAIIRETAETGGAR